MPSFLRRVRNSVMRGPLFRRSRRPLFGSGRAFRRDARWFGRTAGRVFGPMYALQTAYEMHNLARRVGRNISNKRKWNSYKEAPNKRIAGFSGLTPSQQSVLRKRKYHTPTGQMSEDLQRKIARHGKYRAHKLSRNRLKFATPF